MAVYWVIVFSYFIVISTIKKLEMCNTVLEPKFIFDDFSASKSRQPATETIDSTYSGVQYSPAHHNLSNQQLKLIWAVILLLLANNN